MLLPALTTLRVARIDMVVWDGNRNTGCCEADESNTNAEGGPDPERNGLQCRQSRQVGFSQGRFELSRLVRSSFVLEKPRLIEATPFIVCICRRGVGFASTLTGASRDGRVL
jgi:hypothetical protein